MSVHFIARLENVSSLTLGEVGIIKYSSSASVFKVLDTWTANSVVCESIQFEEEIKEFLIHGNAAIELYTGCLKVDSKIITLEKVIRKVKACRNIIAAICGCNLNIYSTNSRLAVLVGHMARVRDFCFYQDKLFSISEDRTLKIWDLKYYCCEYTTSVLSKAALSTLDVDHDGLRVVVADEDNVLIFFELTDGKRLKLLKKIELQKIFQANMQEVYHCTKV
jgi:WD40 repeat protein